MELLVEVQRHGEEIARVVLNAPKKKNALSIDLRDAVSDALDGLRKEESLKCVILTGAGGAFSAGFDLNEFGIAFGDPEFHRKLWASSDRYHLALLEFPLPIVAAVNGPALGGGMDTAVLCDVRIASEAAVFGHPEAAFGDVVYAPLHDLIGGAAARELCLTGRRIDAAEAKRLGLVVEVVAAEALEARSLELAQAIARGPREVLLRTKAKITARARIEFSSTLAL